MAASMAGRVCIVTGANSGIGLPTAEGLLRLGATVVLACRDREKGEAARAEIVRRIPGAQSEVLHLDLASLDSVRAFAREFQSRHAKLDVLVNNAGVYTRRRHVSSDGLELQFQVNYLGPFLLTNLLLDALRASAPSRIVNVSSQAHQGAKMNFEDLQGERRYSGFDAYNQSKLALVLFTYELAKRLEGTEVTVNVVHPGVIRTNLGRGEYPRAFDVIRLFLKGPEKGARTSLYVATSPALESVTGKYFAKSAEARSSPVSHDAAAAQRLWDVSATLAGISA